MGSLLKSQVSLFVLITALSIGSGLSSATAVVDCNSNGVADQSDISLATSADCNGNSVPDECDTSMRGWEAGAISRVALKTVVNGIFDVPLIPTGAADFNGDGRADLWGWASGGSGASRIFVSLNNGDNTFPAPVVMEYEGIGDTTFDGLRDVQPNDFDGDGFLDLIGIFTSNYLGVTYSQTFLFLRNKHDGTFDSRGSNLSALLPALATGLTARIIPAAFSSRTAHDFAILYQGRLYGAAQLGATPPSGPLQFSLTDLGDAVGAEALVADSPLNSAKVVRIVAYNNRGAVAVASGIPGQTFRPSTGVSGAISGEDIISTAVSAPGLRDTEFVALPLRTPVTAGLQQTALELDSGMPRNVLFRSSVNVFKLQQPADFNGDGLEDLLMFGTNGTEILIKRETASYDRLRIFAPSPLGSAIAAADFNGDSKLDLLFADEQYQVAIVLNASTTPYQLPVEVDADANQVPDRCERAVSLDWDGDRRSDVTLVRFGYPLEWFVAPSSVSGGLFVFPYSVRFGLPGDTIMAGDYDGDGRTEPGVTRLLGNNIEWYSLDHAGNTQQGSFGLAGDQPLTGYFDADRSLDRTVVRTLGNQLRWYVQPSTDSEHAIEFDWGLRGDTPFSADLNGDGINEAVVGRNIAGQILWYARSLDGAFSVQAAWGLAGDKMLPPSDLDGDRRADFLVARPVAGQVSVFSRDTFDGVYASTLVGPSGSRAFPMNFSGIGAEELAARDDTTNSVTARFSFAKASGSVGTALFGFASDDVVGSDGRRVTPVGARGLLACNGYFAPYDGPGGNTWTAAPGQKPEFRVDPALVPQIRSVELFDANGSRLQALSVKSRKLGQYVGRDRLTISPTGPGYVVQLRLRGGAVMCLPVGVSTLLD